MSFRESWHQLLARIRGRRAFAPRDRRASRLRERLSARRTTIGGAWQGVPGDARDSDSFSDPGNRGGPLGADDEMLDGGNSTRFPPGSRPREPRERKAG